MSSPQTESRQTESPPTESTQTDVLRAGMARVVGPWWVFLLTGIAWLIISMVVLRFDTTSAYTIGILMGVVFLGAMANEFMNASVWSPWAWARVLMGILFLAGAIWAFISPLDAFWTLASILGVLLILQGTLVLITSIESRAVNSVWGLGVATGVLEILLGFWASQQVISARAGLLIFYVGLLALFRGMTEIVLAFELKGAKKDLSPTETGVPAQRDPDVTPPGR
ncbi:MAG: HdeD family acid-resistance protein [Nocardioidaceae bacterium]